MQGQDFVFVKNSLSTYWGMDGYVLMSRFNNCGVAMDASYAVIVVTYSVDMTKQFLCVNSNKIGKIY